MKDIIMITIEKLSKNDIKKEVDHLEISENIITNIIENTYTVFDHKNKFKSLFGIEFKEIKDPNKVIIVFKKECK